MSVTLTETQNKDKGNAIDLLTRVGRAGKVLTHGLEGSWLWLFAVAINCSGGLNFVM